MGNIRLLNTVWILVLPIPSVAARIVDSKTGFPAKLLGCFGRIEVAARNITAATWMDRVGNWFACSFLEGFDYL